MRMDRGLSQQQVADCLGLDRSTYVKYELGGSIKLHVDDLAKFYNVSTDYLLTDTPYMQAYKPGEAQLPDNLVPIVELVKDLFKDTIQEMLNAELTEHLGYEKNEYTDNNENDRNGYSQKTVHSSEGDITLDIPRDRQGTFDPVIVEKGQKDISNIEDKIIRMYARGMSNENIYEEMQELYGVKVSPDMVTAITDKIIPEIREWQKRQLEEQYAIVFVDATYFNVKQDGIVVKKAVYIALGVTMTGEKEILGFYIGDSESAKYWTSVLNEIKNRGVKDILIICADGLKGLKEAIGTVYPTTEFQRCIVHMISNTLQYVSYKDRKELAKDLKQNWLFHCDAARVPEYVSQEEMNKILDV